MNLQWRLIVIQKNDPPMEDFDFLCDNCSNTENFEAEGDFYEAVALAKTAGWRIVKVNDEWKHYCPACQRVHKG